MEQTVLKPCPFCARENFRTETKPGNVTLYRITCICGTCGPYGIDTEGSFELWNLRKGPGKPDVVGDFVRGMNKDGMIARNTDRYLNLEPVEPLEQAEADSYAPELDRRLFRSNGEPLTYCIKHKEPFFNRGCTSCQIEEQDAAEC